MVDHGRRVVQDDGNIKVSFVYANMLSLQSPSSMHCVGLGDDDDILVEVVVVGLGTG